MIAVGGISLKTSDGEATERIFNFFGFMVRYLHTNDFLL